MVSVWTYRLALFIVTGASGLFVLLITIFLTKYFKMSYFYIDAVNESSSEIVGLHDVISNGGENTRIVPTILNQYIGNGTPDVTPQNIDIENGGIERHQNTLLVKSYESCFSFSIDKAHICRSERNMTLLIIVTSGVSHASARNAVRDTWGGYARELGIPVLFLLGTTLNDTEQRKVECEDYLFQDILKENCVDTYRNLTLKTVSMMKWISLHCSHVPFVLKSDDDVVVNIDRLLLFLENLNSTEPSIYGRLALKAKPYRSKSNKWFVSESEYKETVYPDYAVGPTYVFTGNASPKLFQESLNTNFLFLEDVLVTGIVAEKVGIKRIHNNLFHNSKTKKLVYESFGEIITSHNHSPKDMRKIWLTRK